MKKVLKVGYPHVTAHMTHAPLLSILSADEKYTPWFICSYIQLRSGASLDFDSFYYNNANCPYVEQYHIPVDLYREITPLVKRLIDDNEYIVLIVDTFYIAEYDRYKSWHMDHPIFIYGYDDEAGIFYTGDFFKGGKYEFREVAQEQMEEAYQKCNNTQWLYGITVYKLKDAYFDFQLFELAKILENYLSFSESTAPTTSLYDCKQFYGIESAYMKVIMTIRQIFIFNHYDSQTIPIFCDHKKVLCIMAQYLHESFGFDISYLEEADNIYKLSKSLRNKVLKAVIARDYRTLSVKMFEEVHKKEVAFLHNVLSLTTHKSSYLRIDNFRNKDRCAKLPPQFTVYLTDANSSWVSLDYNGDGKFCEINQKLLVNPYTNYEMRYCAKGKSNTLFTAIRDRYYQNMVDSECIRSNDFEWTYNSIKFCSNDNNELVLFFGSDIKGKVSISELKIVPFRN